MSCQHFQRSLSLHVMKYLNWIWALVSRDLFRFQIALLFVQEHKIHWCIQGSTDSSGQDRAGGFRSRAGGEMSGSPIVARRDRQICVLHKDKDGWIFGWAGDFFLFLPLYTDIYISRSLATAGRTSWSYKPQGFWCNPQSECSYGACCSHDIFLWDIRFLNWVCVCSRRVKT